ncbi:MAG TPA: POTRA domain-containing protein [Terriglobales bacterium]
MAFFCLVAQVATAGARGGIPGANETPTNAPTQAGVEDSYWGMMVKEVRFPNVPSEKDAGRLRQMIAQHPGSALDRELIRRSMEQLHATGRFADISAEVDQAGADQVVLSFLTKPNFFVSSVDVLGLANRPTRSQVVDASKLQLGHHFNHERLMQALENIRRLMEENGYYRSQVEAVERSDVNTQQVAVILVVHPGLQAKVGEVTVTGNAGFSVEEVQKIAKLRTGELVSVQRVSNGMNQLRKKYEKQNRLLARVFVRSKNYQRESNQVNYDIEIDPGPVVQITAEGFKIRNKVLKQNVPVFEESAVDDDLLNEGRQNLLNYMQSRGYFNAKVTIRKETEANGVDLKIAYVIDPHARHRLVKVLFTGNEAFPTATLRARMQVQETGRAFANGRYSQLLLERDIRSLEQLYRANGYLTAKVTSNLLEDYEGKENDQALEVNVIEGPQTRVGAFEIVGNDTFPEDKFRPSVIQTAVGQPFSEAYISQDRDNILNYYYNHGFLHASFQASAHPIPGEENRMSVRFKIEEGEQVFIDQTYVSGLENTRPYIVNRELQTHPGDPLSQVQIMENQRRLYDLGIFNNVDTAVQNPNGNERYKNVLVDVQEAKRYTFNYGAGLEFQTGQPSAVGTNQAKGETGVSPRVSLDITRLNFLGRNETITFKSDVGGLQQRGLISYGIPRFFGSKSFRFAVTGFYDHTIDVTTFTSERLEGSVQTEETVSKATTLVYRFVFRRVKASDIAISPESIPLYSLPARIGGPSFSYLRNTRDNDLETTKGTYNTIDAQFASSVFASQADFGSVVAQNSTYYAFGKNRPRDKKFVFARSTRVGVQVPFGSTVSLPPGQACPQATETSCPGISVIPLAELLLAGGANSLRGFGLNQAGPRDPTTGFPVGGSGLFVNNLELRLPPMNLPYVQDNLSFAVFEDMGNVFTDGRIMLDNLLRWRQKDPQLCLQDSTALQCDYAYVSQAVGVGVRYKTPVGPVRFDFGYNLNPPAFPSCQATPSVNGQSVSPRCVAATTTNGVTTLPYFVPQHLTHFNVYFSIGQTF